MKCLLIFLVPSQSSSTPFYPQNVANQGAPPNSFSFRCLHLWTCSWAHQRAWGCIIYTTPHTNISNEKKNDNFDGIIDDQQEWGKIGTTTQFLNIITIANDVGIKVDVWLPIIAKFEILCGYPWVLLPHNIQVQ